MLEWLFEPHAPPEQGELDDPARALQATPSMVSPATHPRYDIADYVRLEAYSNVRHEFIEGQIYAVAGGTPEHGLYAANIISLLSAALAGRRCRVQTSDVRIRVQATGLATYPDVSVVCGIAERDPDDTNAIVNPNSS